MIQTREAAHGVPLALHRNSADLPFVRIADGAQLQLLQVDIDAGLWVIRTRLQPGVTLQRHKHTGEVFAFTVSGCWKYLEYPEVNTAGSYLFEPAGSVHTLHVPASCEQPADMWFAIRGANLELDSEGRVENVVDAGAALEIYRQLCREAGHGDPDIIGA